MGHSVGYTHRSEAADAAACGDSAAVGCGAALARWVRTRAPLFAATAWRGTGVKFRRRNLDALGDLICGNFGSDDPGSSAGPRYFPYRSSMYITEFFADLDTDLVHDGTTRHRWVGDVLEAMLTEPHDGPAHPPEIFCRVIDHLMSPAEALNEGPASEPTGRASISSRPGAVRTLRQRPRSTRPAQWRSP